MCLWPDLCTYNFSNRNHSYIMVRILVVNYYTKNYIFINYHSKVGVIFYEKFAHWNFWWFPLLLTSFIVIYFFLDFINNISKVVLKLGLVVSLMKLIKSLACHFTFEVLPSIVQKKLRHISRGDHYESYVLHDYVFTTYWLIIITLLLNFVIQITCRQLNEQINEK